MKKAKLLGVFLLSLFLVKSIFSFDPSQWAGNYTIFIQNNANVSVWNYDLMYQFNSTQLISQGLLQPTCNDIRFIGPNGQELNYYLASCGYISVNLSYNTGTSCIYLQNNPAFPATPNTPSGSWYFTFSSDAYETLNLYESSTIVPVILNIQTNALVAIWVNGQLVYENNPFTFSCNDNDVDQVDTSQSFDITNYLHQGNNVIYIWATGNSPGLYINTSIYLPSDNLTINQNGVYNLPGIVFVQIPYLPASGNTSMYMYYGNPNAVSKSTLNAFIQGSYPALQNLINSQSQVFANNYDVFDVQTGSASNFVELLPQYFNNSGSYLVPFIINSITVPIAKGYNFVIPGLSVGYSLLSNIISTQPSNNQVSFVAQNQYYGVLSAGQNLTINLNTPIYWVPGYNLGIYIVRAGNQQKYPICKPSGGTGCTVLPSGTYAVPLNNVGLVSYYGNGPAYSNYPYFDKTALAFNLLPIYYYNGYYMYYLNPAPTYTTIVPPPITNTTNVTLTNGTNSIVLTINYPSNGSIEYVSKTNYLLYVGYSVLSNYTINSCNISITSGNITYYFGNCSTAINVSGINPGWYTLTINVSNIAGGNTTANTIFYLDYPPGTYNFTIVQTPSYINGESEYINTSFVCTGGECDYGSVQLNVPSYCAVLNPVVNIPMLSSGQQYNVSFLIDCIYNTSYPFTINYYIAGSLINSTSFSIPPASLSISYTLSTNNLTIYANPTGFYNNVTLYTVINQGWVINSTANQIVYNITVPPNQNDIIYTTNVTPGQTFAIYVGIQSPSLFTFYPVQSIYLVVQATQPPIIYSATIPQINYQGLPVNLCYNITDQVAVTNVTINLIYNNVQQTIVENYFSPNVSACVPLNVTQLGNYSVLLQACDYSGLCISYPTINFQVVPYPPYNITIYPNTTIVTQSSPVYVTIYFYHPLQNSVQCVITNSQGTLNLRETLYNNTNVTVPLSFSSYGVYNLYLSCVSPYTAITVPFTIIYSNLPPLIEGINITNDTINLYLYDQVGLEGAIYNITIGNSTQIYNVSLSGNYGVLQLPLILSQSVIIKGYIYDLAGLSTPFTYSYTLAQPIAFGPSPGTPTYIGYLNVSSTNSTNITNITISGSPSNYIALLIPTINATVIPKGIQITASVIAKYYPVNCTIYPFNTTMIIQTSAPYTAIITPNITPGTYIIYATCTDSVGDMATSNMVVLNVTPQDIYMFGTSAFVGTENGIYSILLLGGVVALLGYLMRSKILVLIGAGLAASLAPLYTGVISGQPVFATIETGAILVGLYILHKYLLYHAFE
ncbi:MAG: hypothetical protein ACP5GJ_03780 [Nanopusillaceae archaeon]